jgi:PAS domain-containing protein
MAGRLAQVGGWFVDFPAVRVVWSDMLADLHDEPPGHSPTIEEAFAYYAAGHRPKIEAALQACVEYGTPFDHELEIVTAKGRRIWGRAIGEAVRDSAGKVCRVQGAFQDISVRKRADDASRALADRLADTLRSISDAFITLDREWRYTYVNDEAERMFGRGKGTLIGRVLWDEFPEARGTEFEAGCKAAMADSKAASFEAFYQPWDAWVAVRCFPSKIGLSASLRDVREHLAVPGLQAPPNLLQGRRHARLERTQQLCDRLGIVSDEPFQDTEVDNGRPAVGRSRGRTPPHDGRFRACELAQHEGLGLQGHPFGEHRLQCGEPDRLGHVVVHAGRPAVHGLALLSIRGERDDRNSCRRALFLADDGHELVSIHLGHVQVRHQEGVRTSAPFVESFSTRRGDSRRVAEQRKLLRNDFLVDLVVLGHEDESAHLDRSL